MQALDAGKEIIPKEYSKKYAGKRLGAVIFDDEGFIFKLSRDNKAPEALRKAASVLIVGMLSDGEEPVTPSAPPVPRDATQAPPYVEKLNEKTFTTPHEIMTALLDSTQNILSQFPVPIGYDPVTYRLRSYVARLRARSDGNVMVEITHPQVSGTRYPHLLDAVKRQEWAKFRESNLAAFRQQSAMLFPVDPVMLFGIPVHQSPGSTGVRNDYSVARAIEDREDVEIVDPMTGKKMRLAEEREL